MAVRQDHDGGVSQADGKAGVLFHDSPAQRDVIGGERFELIRTAVDFVDECDLRGMTDACADQIIELRQHQG